MSLASSMCGSEPIAGYRVTERLGAGGYGEVWKAEAPGGLQKAIKFIYGYLNDDKATRELKALNRIKQMRHPFLLSLERIEVVDGQLIIVTELADASLRDRFHACQAAGTPAVQRDELLGYLRDAADALDYLSASALQHLDVKPENLLLVGGRVKVADFGLVMEIKDHTCSMLGGMTPVYASPETFDGRPHANSDQYSLAIVYQEMLTGTVPFPGNTAAQLASQHLFSRPRLESLPEHDRQIIAKALEKKPSDRFPNSRAMVDALLAAGAQGRHDVSGATDRVGGRVSVPGGPGRPIEEPPLRRTPARSWRGMEPSCETPAPRPRLSTAVVPKQHERIAVANLPPLEPGTECGLRPTVILGIGGTASLVLNALKRRLVEQFGDLAETPLFQTLLFDTDPATLSQQGKFSGEVSLAGTEFLPLPLRKPQEYREESIELLQWLSRRWLYNIPRSLQTEGMRPLGRLALVDHFHEVRDAVREALRCATSELARTSAEEKTGLPLRTTSPRVVVVASISGGTGSGMVLDVGYAVQMLLAEMDLAEDGLCGVLLHSTNRVAAGKDLAIVNAYACLSELDHFHREGYPGEPSCDLPALGKGRPPFSHAYYVHLGNDLGDNEYRQAVDSVAEYLLLDSTGSGGAVLDQCRLVGTADASADPVCVRTFGICRVGYQQDVLETASNALVKALLAGWTLEPRKKTEQSWPDGRLEPLIAGLFAEHGLRTASLIQRSQADIRSLLLPSPQAALESIVTTVLAEESEGDVSQPLLTRWSRLTEQARALLGLADENESAGSSGSLHRAIDAALVTSSQSIGTRLEQFVHSIVNQPDLRLPGGHQACEKLIDRLRLIETELNAEDQQLAAQLACPPCDPQVTPTRSRWGRRQGRAARQQEVASLADQLAEYGGLQLSQFAVDGARRLVKMLIAKLTATADLLMTLRRELRHVGDQIHLSDAWTDAGSLLSGKSAKQDVDGIMLRELHRHFSQLAAEFERQIDAALLDRHGGLSGLAHCGSEQLCSVTAQFKSAARAHLTQALRSIDVASIVLGPLGQSGDEQANLRQFTQRAWPKALDCGGAKRLLLALPQGPTRDRLSDSSCDAIEEVPTILVGSASEVIACYEAEQLSLTNVAASLLSDDPQLAQIAYRLHTRTDVQWRPL